MRALVCALALALTAAAAHAPAQTPEQPAQAVRGDERRCPDVRVTYTGNVPVVGSPVKFATNVSGAPNAAALTYRWQVSAGAITSGQGGPELEVDTRGNVGSVTATVTVGGLPPDCPNTALLNLSLVLCSLPPPPDAVVTLLQTFEKLPPLDEEASLDSFAATLASETAAMGYVIAYGGRRGPRGEVPARLERMKRHLVGRRGLPEGQIVTIDGGYREEAATEFWLVPVTAAPPTPTPTVDPAAVEFTDRPTTRRQRGGPARARRPPGSE